MRSGCMGKRSKEASARTVTLAKRHIEEQRSRIARQRELVADLERDRRERSVINSARALLSEMLDVLHRMTAEKQAAQKQLHH